MENRWGILDLLDILKEADFGTDFTSEFTSVASRQITDKATLRRRLLLVLFALGTNQRDNLRRAIARLVNATFAIREEA